MPLLIWFADEGLAGPSVSIIDLSGTTLKVENDRTFLKVPSENAFFQVGSDRTFLKVERDENDG